VVRNSTEEGQGGNDEGTASNAKATWGQAREKADEGIEGGACRA